MNESIELINRVSEILGQSGNKAIAEYAIWHIAAALAWMSTGISLIIFSIKWKKIPDEWDKGLVPIIRAAIISVGALCILLNIGDIASPEAIAIHQLLSDIHG